MRILITFFLFFIIHIANAQTSVTGKISDVQGNPVKNANIILKDTYDGTSSNDKGEFSFETTEKGTQTLVIENSNYDVQEITIELPLTSNLDIVLIEKEKLNEVVFTAGSMKAKSNTNETLLSSLDVVTTASAMGDAIGAFQTLPGTTINANDGRLYVRGGDATETAITIDGLQVFQPYGASVNNVPTRARFSPFLFKGLVLNTGGYDVGFGNALSGIVEFYTEDFTQQNEWQFDIMTLGLGARLNKRWEKDGLTLSTAYFNLTPYNKVFPTRDTWKKSPQGVGGEMVYRHQFENGILKSYFAYESSTLDIIQEDINYSDGIRNNLLNNNFYTNTTYNHHFHKKLKGFIGVSYGNAKTDIEQNQSEIDILNKGLNAKAQIEWKLNSKHQFIIGSEILKTQNKLESLFSTNSNKTIIANYAEHQWYFLKKMGLKYGIRGEYDVDNNKYTFAPRASLAFKLNAFTNFNAVVGRYYQSLNFNYYYREPNEMMVSDHYLFNVFYKKEKEIVRLEMYHKNYSNLPLLENNIITQKGEGKVQGLELYYRNSGKHFSNLSYWISYSYIDSERRYNNYPEMAMPNFVAKHNFSFVGKYWISSLRSQIGFDYQFNSGRYYTNPNVEGFQNEKSRPYNVVNVSWAYLYKPNMIFFASVSNVFNIKNNFGYDFAHSPDINGVFAQKEILPANNQFFFLGCFITISKDKTKNQLDNL